MLGAVVERYPAIKMRATFRDVSYTRKGNAHDAVCYQQRRACPLFLGERQELRRQGAHGVTVECHVGCDPETVENRKQQQRVFGRLSDRFSLFDQYTRPLHSRLGFRRGRAFGVNEWGYERNLKLDLFATKRGGAR